MRTSIIALCLFVLLSVSARAEDQEAKLALAGQYVQLTFTNDPSAYFISIIDNMLGLKGSDSKMAQTIHDLLRQLDWDPLLENYTRNIAEALTHEELTRLVDFYSGEMGAALLAKADSFAMAVGQVLRELGAAENPTELDVSGLDPAKVELAGRFVDVYTHGDVRGYIQGKIMEQARAAGATRAQLDEVVQAMDEFDWEWFVHSLVAKLTQAYTVEELEAMVEFTATPGTVEMMEKLIAVSETLQQDLLAQLNEALQEYKQSG